MGSVRHVSLRTEFRTGHRANPRNRISRLSPCIPEAGQRTTRRNWTSRHSPCIPEAGHRTTRRNGHHIAPLRTSLWTPVVELSLFPRTSHWTKHWTGRRTPKLDSAFLTGHRATQRNGSVSVISLRNGNCTGVQCSLCAQASVSLRQELRISPRIWHHSPSSKPSTEMKAEDLAAPDQEPGRNRSITSLHPLAIRPSSKGMFWFVVATWTDYGTRGSGAGRITRFIRCAA